MSQDLFCWLAELPSTPPALLFAIQFSAPPRHGSFKSPGHFPRISGWWLNQPIWKNISQSDSTWKSFPNRDENISNHHPVMASRNGIIFYQKCNMFSVLFVAKDRWKIWVQYENIRQRFISRISPTSLFIVLNQWGASHMSIIVYSWGKTKPKWFWLNPQEILWQIALKSLTHLNSEADLWIFPDIYIIYLDLFRRFWPEKTNMNLRFRCGGTLNFESGRLFSRDFSLHSCANQKNATTKTPVFYSNINDINPFLNTKKLKIL